MFLLFVRRKRAMLLLIPVPAAFAVAPTLVNAVRYADLGMWRQLFGDITVPTSSANGSPASLSLFEAAQCALGWRMGSTDYADLAVTVLFGVITLLALCFAGAAVRVADLATDVGGNRLRRRARPGLQPCGHNRGCRWCRGWFQRSRASR